MKSLTNKELINIAGGAMIDNLFDWIIDVYRTIKIKLLMKKLFID
jgi:bacteriocin-like protein